MIYLSFSKQDITLVYRYNIIIYVHVYRKVQRDERNRHCIYEPFTILNLEQSEISYVYLTVHHLDSWIKRDQLDVTCFIIPLFNAQQVSDVNTSILRSLRPICWVISWVVLLWFDVCWCYVVVWLGWCGIRMRAEAHTTPAKPQRNNNNIYLLQLGCYPVAVIILHVNKHEIGYY